MPWLLAIDIFPTTSPRMECTGSLSLLQGRLWRTWARPWPWGLLRCCRRRSLSCPWSRSVTEHLRECRVETRRRTVGSGSGTGSIYGLFINDVTHLFLPVEPKKGCSTGFWNRCKPVLLPVEHKSCNTVFIHPAPFLSPKVSPKKLAYINFSMSLLTITVMM